MEAIREASEQSGVRDQANIISYNAPFLLNAMEVALEGNEHPLPMTFSLNRNNSANVGRANMSATKKQCSTYSQDEHAYVASVKQCLNNKTIICLPNATGRNPTCHETNSETIRQS